MYKTVSLYTTLKINTFLRNNYFLCKHNLALRQREKVMQVKQWSSYWTPDHLTVPWQSFSLDTQAFNKNRVQFTSWLVKPDDSIQHNSHSHDLASQQSDAQLFHPVHVGQRDLAETEGSHHLSGKIHSQTFLNKTLHDCGTRTVKGICAESPGHTWTVYHQWLGQGRGTWDIGLGSNSYSNSMTFSS